MLILVYNLFHVIGKQLSNNVRKLHNVSNVHKNDGQHQCDILYLAGNEEEIFLLVSEITYTSMFLGVLATLGSLQLSNSGSPT